MSIDVVTGASGFLGGNVVRALLARGRSVRAIDSTKGRIDGVEHVVADVRNPDQIAAAFKGAERVFHLAARITTRDDDAPEIRAINVDGVRNVVDACIAQGVKRLVHFSSIHAFSIHPEDGVVDEARSLCDEPDAGVYDRTKRDGQRIVEAATEELDAVIVHPTGVMGPHDYRPSKTGGVLLELFRGGMPVVVEGGFNWVDARDVAEGAIAAAERGRRGERYLLSNEWMSLRDLGTLAGEISGRAKRRYSLPRGILRAAVPLASLWGRADDGEPRVSHASLRAVRHHRQISNEKARRELGYAPRPLRKTLEDVFEFYRSTGMLGS
jgi:dihydroflavonol-4-reductase